MSIRSAGPHRRSLGLAAALAVFASMGADRPVLAQAEAGVVTGIGGFFFRAEAPAGLALWYEEQLGVDRVPETYDEPVWTQEAGPTVFGPFSADTEYFGAPEQQWMINFRVQGLDALVARLRAAGIAVEVDPEVYPNGRFARLVDPEGNPIQLWEPAGP